MKTVCALAAPLCWVRRAELNKNTHKRVWAWYALAGAFIILDQVVKGLVRAYMTPGETRPLIPHFIELLYVENTGGAFSIFENFTWVLALLSAVVTVALVLALWKGALADSPWAKFCVTLVLAGAAGNLIDRVSVGKVTDMFNFTFMRFGVFNVADICVVCGIVGYAVWLLFARKGGEEDDGHEADADSPD